MRKFLLAASILAGLAVGATACDDVVLIPPTCEIPGPDGQPIQVPCG